MFDWLLAWFECKHDFVTISMVGPKAAEYERIRAEIKRLIPRVPAHKWATSHYKSEYGLWSRHQYDVPPATECHMSVCLKCNKIDALPLREATRKLADLQHALEETDRHERARRIATGAAQPHPGALSLDGGTSGALSLAHGTKRDDD